MAPPTASGEPVANTLAPFPLHRWQTGFSYLAVMLFVAIIGASLAAVGELWHTTQLREKEKDLLFVGHEYRRAIQLYYANTPGPAKQYPRELADLIKDPRQQDVRRYLRKLYPDPITNKTDWGLVKNADGSIAGVYSLSDDTPMKISNFTAADAGFEGAEKYSDWKFVYQTAQQNSQPVPPGNQPPPPVNRLAPQRNPFAR